MVQTVKLTKFRTVMTTVGASLPAKGASDYHHLNSIASSYPWASVYWW